MPVTINSEAVVVFKTALESCSVNFLPSMEPATSTNATAMLKDKSNRCAEMCATVAANAMGICIN